MPTFNAGRFLSDSIESVLNQTHQDLELLISDDGSTDPLTLQTLRKFTEKDPRVKVAYLEGNNGPGVARNNSIRLAKGRYIAFCDSDDRWFPTKLEEQISFMEKKKCALSCTSYVVCDFEDREMGIVIAPECITLEMMKRDNKIGCLTAIYDTKLLGGKFYMPELRKRQDWALFLTILIKSQPAYAITKPLAYYRRHNNSVSSNKLSLVRYNIKVYETVLHYSKLKSYFYFFFLFLPTYYAKILKRNIDSYRYLAKKNKR